MLGTELSGLSPATLRYPASLRSGRHFPVPSFVVSDSPCFAQKAGDFQSVENPARRIRLACFWRPGKQMEHFTWGAHRDQDLRPHGFVDEEFGF